MAEDKYSLPEAHLHFAKNFNSKAWHLLSKLPRSIDENEEMLLAAQSSLYHWQQIGAAVNIQRGHWLLSHVYIALGEPVGAMKHATRCLEITKAQLSEMKDFDIAYAFEAMARTYALLGDIIHAKEYYDMGLRVGQSIKDPQDKHIFMNDFSQGAWYGVV